MQEHHFYDLVKEEYEPGKPVIPVCCSDTTPDDPTCSDCCYDEWKKELKEVNQRYSQQKEAADLVQKQIDLITDRRNRYKKWYEELLVAEDLSRDLCIQLDVIISQSHKIWFNTCKANEAVKILFGMIHDFFQEVDYLKCRYDELWNCIINNMDPSLQEDKGIKACLKSYSDKLDIVIKARDELIKLIVTAVKFAQLMRNNLNTSVCLADNEDPCAQAQANPGLVFCENQIEGKYVYGFKSVICEWYRSFNCGEKCPDSNTTPPAPPQPDPYNTNQNTPPAPNYAGGNQPNQPALPPPDECEVSCDFDPVFKLPICKDKYKECVKNWLDADNQKLVTLTGEIVKLNKSKEGALACKSSLTKAIEEADPKLRCK